jgi:7-keto-8-aminopelargonate synthetase-like enzyme
VSDTIFSMDGDVADVASLLELARRHDAWLVLDEAHATGVIGPGGRGAAAEAGVRGGEDRLVRVVTLSKALGAGGGAVLGSPRVRQLLLQRGRALIFSSGLPHPSVAAARAALRVLIEEPERVARVRARACRLRAALSGLPVTGRQDVPIVSVVVGEAAHALTLERRLLEAGYLVQAVRPPTVAPGSSRVRLVPTAAHSERQVEAAAVALRAAMEGLDESLI